MEESQFSVSRLLGKTKSKQISLIALGLASLVFVLSVIPVQQVDVVFSSVLEYWLANINSLGVIPLSLSTWHSVAIIVQSYCLFVLACLAVGIVLYARKVYRAATIIALLPLIGVFLLIVLEWIGGLRL